MNLESLSSTSASFVSKVRRQDIQAWVNLTRLYGPMVYRWIRQYGFQTSDAEDMMQEVFWGVATSISRFEFEVGTGSFRRWLWGITRNKIRKHAQQRNREPLAMGGSDARHQFANLADDTPEEALALSEQSGNGQPVVDFDADASLVHRAMGLLESDFEEQTWRAFWRMAVDGQSSADVADELGMTKKAVRQAKYRVLRRLRDELDAPSLPGE